MRRLLFSLLVLAFTLPALAQAKHPFTFDDMMKLKRVGDPQVSPDGKWVIFSVVDVDLEANTKTPHMWIVPRREGRSGRSSPIRTPTVRAGRRMESGSRFCRRRRAARRCGLRIRWRGGKSDRSYKLTSMPTEAVASYGLRTGRTILFASDVYPECDDPQETAPHLKKWMQRQGACGTHENSKVKALIFDHLLYRHWNAYKEGKRTHIFVIPADISGISQPGGVSDWHEAARDLTPGDYDAPVFSLGGQDDYAFSPDGQEICYASNHDKNPAASTNNDLWIVPVSGGAAKNITADNPASDTSPLYSPDGRYIAYRAQQRPGYESDRFRLMLYDRKTGEKKNLTEDLDRWVGSLRGCRTRHRIYFLPRNAGTSWIYPRMPDGTNSANGSSRLPRG